ncbi:MAG: RcnB family protein [Pseudomonadota bacterium]|nr:RcnB family protein [Pseudomonadota bacterium]
MFNLSNYYDPYRSNYRRFSIGISLWPSYYSSRYWLNDPWQYRLPPAYGPYRWVRYYNDALLVNIYTGRVVDVEYGFFW